MDGADAFSKSRERARRLGHRELVEDSYRGVDLAPSTLDSLVTWDVSGHARREQDRLSSAQRNLSRTRGGY
jgi:hypothetical protein